MENYLLNWSVLSEQDVDKFESTVIDLVTYITENAFIKISQDFDIEPIALEFLLRFPLNELKRHFGYELLQTQKYQYEQYVGIKKVDLSIIFNGIAGTLADLLITNRPYRVSGCENYDNDICDYGCVCDSEIDLSAKLVSETKYLAQYFHQNRKYNGIFENEIIQLYRNEYEPICYDYEYSQKVTLV